MQKNIKIAIAAAVGIGIIGVITLAFIDSRNRYETVLTIIGDAATDSPNVNRVLASMIRLEVVSPASGRRVQWTPGKINQIAKLKGLNSEEAKMLQNVYVARFLCNSRLELGVESSFGDCLNRLQRGEKQ